MLSCWRWLGSRALRWGDRLLWLWPDWDRLCCWTGRDRGLLLDQGGNAVAKEGDIPLQALNVSAQLIGGALAAAPDHEYRNCENNDEKDCHESG